MFFTTQLVTHRGLAQTIARVHSSAAYVTVVYQITTLALTLPNYL